MQDQYNVFLSGVLDSSHL